MFASVFQRLFECARKHLGCPMAPMRQRGAPQGDSYFVCLDCGRRFAYDAKQWRSARRCRTTPMKRRALSAREANLHWARARRIRLQGTFANQAVSRIPAFS